MLLKRDEQAKSIYGHKRNKSIPQVICGENVTEITDSQLNQEVKDDKKQRVNNDSKTIKKYNISSDYILYILDIGENFENFSENPKGLILENYWVRIILAKMA